MKFAMTFVGALAVVASTARADVSAQKLYDQVTPSLVAVQYQFKGETMNREWVGPGIVVSDDGLIMMPMNVVNPVLPDEQLKDFKIIVPSQDKDAEELDAEFLGRDERSDVAFVRAKSAHKWTPIKFEEAPPTVGETVYSVGLLSQAAAYKTYFMSAVTAAQLRGETPQILVQGGLAGAGSPVFNADGKAIGLVESNTFLTGAAIMFDGRLGQTQINAGLFLNDTENNHDTAELNLPPKFFVPARDFLASLNDLPVAGQPQKLPWIGVPNMRGIDKDTAEAFNLKNVPAIEIGEVLPHTPADDAGLKKGNIITQINGKPLERPDQPEELPGILGKQILRMKVGGKVTFTVIPTPGEPAKDVTMTLATLPKRANLAKRFYAEDLGFVAREMVFTDIYRLRMPSDSKGVVVALLKPGSSAESAKLHNGDVITQLNGQPVVDIEQFKTDYEAFRKDKPKEAVVLVVIRRYPGTESIRIEPPR